MRELRQRRGLTAEQLAERMTEVGVPWNRGVVAKLETGRRQAVSVDELVGLSVVLDTAIAALLETPMGPRSAVEVLDQMKLEMVETVRQIQVMQEQLKSLSGPHLAEELHRQLHALLKQQKENNNG